MSSYPSERDLLAALDRGDRLLRECAAGRLTFQDFCAGYDGVYWSFALDGHESDQAGNALLARYASRIAPHRMVAETILANVCSDADAARESYRMAGRFGSTEALARLRLVAADLSDDGA